MTSPRSRGLAVVTARATFNPDTVSILSKTCRVSGRLVSCFNTSVCFSATFRPKIPVGPVGKPCFPVSISLSLFLLLFHFLSLLLSLSHSLLLLLSPSPFPSPQSLSYQWSCLVLQGLLTS